MLVKIRTWIHILSIINIHMILLIFVLIVPRKTISSLGVLIKQDLEDLCYQVKGHLGCWQSKIWKIKEGWMLGWILLVLILIFCPESREWTQVLEVSNLLLLYMSGIWMLSLLPVNFDFLIMVLSYNMCKTFGFSIICQIAFCWNCPFSPSWYVTLLLFKAIHIIYIYIYMKKKWYV